MMNLQLQTSAEQPNRQFESLNSTQNISKPQNLLQNELTRRSVQNMSARDGGFNVDYSESSSAHQVSSSVQSTPGRMQIAPIELPTKVDKQVQLSGAKVYITVDADHGRLVLLVQE